MQDGGHDSDATRCAVMREEQDQYLNGFDMYGSCCFLIWKTIFGVLST